MKYLLILVLLAGSVILSAHPAKEVTLSFDQVTSILTVNFEHKVKDAGEHFIDEIKVYLNKEVIVEQTITLQDNLETGTVVYKIVEAKAGDKIKVKTKCNKIGKKSAELVIE
jgi:desulfoferrodoxin (superoxide reductase-like protein)